MDFTQTQSCNGYGVLSVYCTMAFGGIASVSKRILIPKDMWTEDCLHFQSLLTSQA